jgi:hypothetical protein
MPISPERQPERDSGHRAGDLELHGWFMLGTGAQEGCQNSAPTIPPRMPPGNPQMGAGELSADRDTKATPYGLQSQISKNWRHFWRTSTQFH